MSGVTNESDDLSQFLLVRVATAGGGYGRVFVVPLRILEVFERQNVSVQGQFVFEQAFAAGAEPQVTAVLTTAAMIAESSG